MELRGRKVLVVGMGRSGEAAAILLKRRGAQVTLTDQKPRSVLEEPAHRLETLGVRLVLGRNSISDFLEPDLIVVSPGVPRDIPPLLAAREAGVEIVGELALASSLIAAPMVAITGTNGKSTTTTFVGHFLHGVGRRVFVGGNLGTALSKAVDQTLDGVVAEVSSFQLEWAPRLEPQVGVLLNLTEDHLDRYADFEDYARTKGRLFAGQGAAHSAVLPEDDAQVRKVTAGISSRIHGFGHGEGVTRGIRHLGGALWLGEGAVWTRISMEGFRPRGRHNVENLMAACVAAHLMGVSADALGRLIPQLEGLPHRLELVRVLDGVRYYNDSKATNVASVVSSLRDFEEPVVLLLGGRGKGGDYGPLARLAREVARTAVVYGEAAPLLKKALTGFTDVVVVGTLEAAVAQGYHLAQPGDSVVLSPACSSYDQFVSYEERGDTFRRLVGELSERISVAS